MTQAFNLSQLANNLNSSGQLDATDGLVNAVPVANGGTGASTASAARGNLGVPADDGSGATGTWPIDISGNASTATTATNSTNASNLVTTNFSIFESSGKLVFMYGSTPIASLSSAGVFIALGDLTAGGTP